MTDQTTAAKVTAIIAEHLTGDATVVTPDAHLVDDLEADSLDCVEVTMALEDGFDVEISDEEANRCHVVSDWIALVEAKVEARAAAQAAA